MEFNLLFGTVLFTTGLCIGVIFGTITEYRWLNKNEELDREPPLNEPTTDELPKIIYLPDFTAKMYDYTDPEISTIK